MKTSSAMYDDENNEQNGNFEIVPSDALAAMEKASIDVQISTARRYPRDFVKVKKQMLSLATLDEETAASCFYKLGRQGRDIEGPSIRLAEIAISCFGNMRAGSRIIGNDGKTVTAQGFCHDLENNTLIAVEVKRRITDKSGRTYSEDMQVVTGNAACAIALRNAAYKVVPFALIKPVYEQAKRVAVGDVKTLAERRTGWLKWFAARGVTEAQVLAHLGKTGVDTIDLSDIETLAGLHTAIKEGSTSVDEVFGEKAKPGAPAKAAPPVATSFQKKTVTEPAPKGAEEASATTPPAETPLPEATATAEPHEPKPAPGPERRTTTDEGVRNLSEENTADSEPVDEFEQMREQIRTNMADSGITMAELTAYMKANKYATKPIISVEAINPGRLQHMLDNWSVVVRVIEDARENGGLK